MPLQITPDVFKWLQSLSLVKEARRSQNSLMQINQAQSSKLMDGFALSTIFRSIFKNKSDEDKLKKLDALKEHSTPAIRLYNWGILTELLKQVGYTLEQSDRSKIINYQPQPLGKLLLFLYELKARDSTLKEPQENTLKVDINQINKKSIQDATNALQFLTICIAKHFKLSPQQTLNLFLDNNKYLSHLLAKGVKNSFESIYTLLDQLNTQAEFIGLRLLCLDQQQNVNFLFNALRTCLISKDEQVASKYCDFLINIYNVYSINFINLQIMRNWINNQGINTLFFCIKKHPTLTSIVFDICYNYLEQEILVYLQLSEKSILWNTQKQRLIFFKTFMEQANGNILDHFSKSSHFEQWNRLFLKTMKKTKDPQQILILLAIMELQWNTVKQPFQQHDMGLPMQYIHFLKNAVMAPNELLFLQATRILFSLMQSLGTVKSPFAPQIYKILVAGYSTFTDLSKIVFMSDNFAVSFKGITGLPGTPLIQHLLNHLQNNKEWSVIELAGILIQQKRIEEDASLDLIEMMTKIAFNDIRFGNLVLNTIFASLTYLNQEIISGFLENNAKQCLAQLYSLSKSINKSLKHLKGQAERMKSSQGNQKAIEAFVAAASKHILCQNMIAFISKSIFLDEELKDMLEASVFHTYIKIKVELKKHEQAELLRPIMASYCPEQDQLEPKIALYMNEAYPGNSQQLRQGGHSHNHLSKSVTLRSEEIATILDPTQLKPSNFALNDLQKLKQKRYDLKTLQVQKQKQKVLKQQRSQKFKTIQHQKRLVESMASIKNDVQYKHIQTIEEKPSMQPETHHNKDMLSLNIKLISLEKQEEESYRDEAESILKKYKKVWKYLFFKYSIKQTELGGEEKIPMGEVWKMLKDYQFHFLKKEQCFTIVRMINEQLKRKNDIQFLNYQGFEDFILQVAVIGYTKNGYPHVPPGQQIHLFLQQLKKATKQKSGSIQIFQNPQQVYFQQTEVIHQFNKRLRSNPDYILPQGYKKIKQTSLQYQYEFLPMLQKGIKSAYLQVLEILDSIIFKHQTLAFHIIQPLSIKSQTFLAKPFFFQNLNQKMKNYSKGYLQPKRSTSATIQNSPIPLPSPPCKKQFRPFINFSLGIKLGIAQTSLKNKSIAEEVACCMEDILNAIENQSPIVKKGNRRKITNQFMRRKKIELVKIETQRKRDQFNWKKRADSVKLQVEILREKQKESEKEKKKKQYLDKKLKSQKQQKLFKQKMSQFQRVKAKIASKKEALLELKAVQQQRVKKEKQQYQLVVEQYFQKQKELIRQKQEQYKSKKQQQKQKNQSIQQTKKQFAKKLYLANLKKSQLVLQKVDQIKQAYDDVWKSTQIQDVFSQHKTSLKLLFDLLLKYQKSKISATNFDEIGLATLNFFSLKFQIIPFMLQKQDISKIFMYATKNDQGNSNRKGINSQKFQEVIFLIATKAKKMLNKKIAKRQKKEQKIKAFLNAQKSAGGNHFQANDVQESSSSEPQQDQQKPTLQEEYLFNAEDVDQGTVQQVFSFLRLSNSKGQMEERYKEALEVKTSKPKNLLIKQIKESLEV